MLGIGAAVAMMSLGTSQANASSATWVITGNTTLTADYNGQILVVGQGVTLNCAGHTVRGDGTGVGINVVSDGVSVSNCQVLGFDTGILTSARATQIRGNDVNHNGQGVRLAGASGGTVSGNSANSNRFWGIILAQGASGNTIHGNSANNNGLIGVALNASNGNLVAGNSANQNGGTGFDSLQSSGNQLLNNVAMNNGNIGFAFSLASGNTVSGNIANNNGTP
ncbi:MAG: right-handed parallel beta-helix repeat-containing protein, partial [Actinomycetota bacterium]|nr:right-handed parallel beta-helix repeat-containing protein [Actinomycetota bacterium]